MKFDMVARGKPEKTSSFKRESTIASDSPVKKGNMTNSNSGLKAKPNTDGPVEQNKKLQKVISELTKKQVETDKALDGFKRKYELLQIKYDQLKKQPVREKKSHNKE